MPDENQPWSGQDELLMSIVAHLNGAGIAYMVSGSVGANFHGEPRATNDVDIVIDPTRAQLDRFLESLGEQYYVSPETARTALDRRSMFNIIDTASSWKVDLIVRRNRPFSETEFERRSTIEFQGEPLSIVSAEDSLLSKLEWSRRSGSDRQLRDAESIARVQAGQLDVEYLTRWAAELGVTPQLQAILEAASQPFEDESGETAGQV